MAHVIGVEWLVATIAPWAVAPHPNFSIDEPRPEAILALIADLRLHDLERYESQAKLADHWAAEIIREAKLSVTFDRQLQAADALTKIALQAEIPIGARAAAALLAAVAYAELDSLDSALPLLDSVIDSTHTAAPDQASQGSADLIHGTLLLQRSMRHFEVGSSRAAEEDSLAVIDLLSSAGPEFLAFPTSQGIGWDAQQVQGDVVDVVVRRAKRIRSTLAPPGSKLWVELVQLRPNWIDVRGERRAEPGLEELLDEQFRTVFRSMSRSTRWVSEDPVYGPFDASLLNAELSADFGEVQAKRGFVGRSRFLRDHSGVAKVGDDGLVDAIRLLRQSRDEKSLRSALNALKWSGPVAVLQESAAQVLRSTYRSNRASRYDLLVLATGADLLSPEERRRALQIVLAFRDQSYEPGSTRPLSSWVQTETVWQTIPALIKWSGLDDKIASEALSLLEVDETPYLLHPLLSGICRELDWSKVSPIVANQWRSWALVRATGELENVALEVINALDSDISSLVNKTDRPIGLALAERLLVEFNFGYAPSATELEIAVDSCIDGMRQIRERAAHHSFGGGGRSAGTLATYLATLLEAASLWDPIIQFLADTSISLDDKAGVLRVLASNYKVVPEPVTRELRGKWEQIGSSSEGAVFEGGGSDFYGAYLRSGRLLKLISPQAYMAKVTELACGSALERLEALRCLAYSGDEEADSAWASTIRLQFSYSDNPTLKANAAFAVSKQCGSNRPLSELEEKRLSELLQADGIEVPHLALRGLLARADMTLVWQSQELIGLIERLASNHPASSVRAAAREIEMHPTRTE